MVECCLQPPCSIAIYNLAGSIITGVQLPILKPVGLSLESEVTAHLPRHAWLWPHLPYPNLKQRLMPRSLEGHSMSQDVFKAGELYLILGNNNMFLTEIYNGYW